MLPPNSSVKVIFCCWYIINPSASEDCVILGLELDALYSWAAVSSAFTGGSGTSKCHPHLRGLVSLWYSGLSEVAAAPSSLFKNS